MWGGVGWELCSSNAIIIHEYTVGVREMLVVDVCDVCVMCVRGLVEHQRMCEEIPAHKRVAQPLTASWR